MDGFFQDEGNCRVHFLKFYFNVDLFYISVHCIHIYYIHTMLFVVKSTFLPDWWAFFSPRCTFYTLCADIPNFITNFKRWGRCSWHNFLSFVRCKAREEAGCGSASLPVAPCRPGSDQTVTTLMKSSESSESFWPKQQQHVYRWHHPFHLLSKPRSL